MTTTGMLGRFLEDQFRAWKRQDEELKQAPAGPVIAITREPGCGGELIARTLANELGLALYDGELVEQIAKDAHVSERVVATLDENLRSELEEWLMGFACGTSFSTTQYMHCLRSILFTIAAHGNAVIVGRGANFVLPAEKKTVGLSLIAPREHRILTIMQELRLSPEDARWHIIHTERDRLVMVKEMGHADIMDDTNYHVVINTALVSTKSIVEIVKEIIRAKSMNGNGTHEQ